MPSSKYSRAHQALIVQRATPCARRSRLLSRSSGHCSAAGSLAFGFGGRCRSGASWSTSLLRLRDSSSRSMAAITLGVAPPMRAAIGRFARLGYRVLRLAAALVLARPLDALAQVHEALNRH
jgi:hypothetical protein